MKRQIVIEIGTDPDGVRSEPEELHKKDFVFPIHKGLPESLTLEEAVNHFERRLIIRALKKSNGVQTKAAELLGTTRRILRYRMDKLGIEISVLKQS